MNELIKNVKEWARERSLIKYENRFKQFAKKIEETGEIAEALAKDNQDLLEDAIGDDLVTSIILAEQCGLDIEKCLERAYNEIASRKGKTIDGVFVKEADLKNERTA